jgi:transposase
VPGKKTGPNSTDRSRPGSKHHVVVDGQGIPLAVSLTGANRHDVTQLVPLVDAIPPIRGRVGRPRFRPDRLYADRAYDSKADRIALRLRGIAPQIPRRNTAHGSGLGIYRWVVERTIAWIHQPRRLRVRFERRADIHEGFMRLTCALICWRALGASLC